MASIRSRTSTASSRSGSQEAYRRDGRGRSPSPTEYFRSLHQTQNNLEMYEYGLNEFIHNGIQKFLDKQAVRDLITAYDSEDIFSEGVENFYGSLYDDNDYDRENHNGNRNEFSMVVKRAQESQMLKMKSVAVDFTQINGETPMKMNVFAIIVRFCANLMSNARFGNNRIQADGDVIEEMWKRQSSQRNKVESRQDQSRWGAV